MQPAARYAAAIGVLDEIIAGAPAERELTDWARKNRYAGSKDRAAVRDIVFECLRNLRSFQHISGISTGRGAVIGQILSNDIELNSIFSGQGYAPTELSADEVSQIPADKGVMPVATALNLPDWIVDFLDDDLRAQAANLNNRAPIDLRVNLTKSNIQSAQKFLKSDGIETQTFGDNDTALRVVGQTRKIPQTDVYKSGKIELQDAGSQKLINLLELSQCKSVLDYCAGGGGKSLAMAALYPNCSFSAYDISQKRMVDLPERAKRAGAKINTLKSDPVKVDQKYDCVVLDVPCSGSGSWRRSPDAKWKLTPEGLSDLLTLQADILAKVQDTVSDSGCLVYMTCSIFREENEMQIQSFLAENSQWSLTFEKRINLSDGTDGFYLAILKR